MLMDLTQQRDRYQDNLIRLARHSKYRFHLQVTHDVVWIEGGHQRPYWIDYKSMNARA